MSMATIAITTISSISVMTRCAALTTLRIKRSRSLPVAVADVVGVAGDLVRTTRAQAERVPADLVAQRLVPRVDQLVLAQALLLDEHVERLRVLAPRRAIRVERAR